MANPAVKNGYLPIANELAEQFAMRNIPGNEMRILWVVLRKTWGWKKDTDRIAFSQFAEATGMKNGNVSRSLKSLVAKRLLLQNGGNYEFNQDYEEWTIAKRLPRTEVAKRQLNNSQKATKSVAKRIVTKERKKLQKKGDEITPKEKAKKFFKGITDFLQKNDTPEAKSMGMAIARVSEGYGVDSIKKKAEFWDEVVAFGDYWQEKDTETGKFERWEITKSKTFDVEGRLRTWFRHKKQWAEAERTFKSKSNKPDYVL
jgi:phage replication O-like protein O